MSRFSNSDPSKALREARAKGYTAARVAQGVPLLDRDLNLLGELSAQSVREVLCRYLGDGLVSGPDAFRIEATPDERVFLVHGPGWAIVGGHEVSIDAPARIEVKDADYVVEEEARHGRPALRRARVWLEVWQREVDDAQDPELANAEDVGMLTSTRLETRWGLQVTGGLPRKAAGRAMMPLAVVRRLGDRDSTPEDLRPVGLTLGRKSAAGSAPGALTLLDEAQVPRIRLDAEKGELELQDADGKRAFAYNNRNLSIHGTDSPDFSLLSSSQVAASNGVGAACIRGNSLSLGDHLGRPRVAIEQCVENHPARIVLKDGSDRSCASLSSDQKDGEGLSVGSLSLSWHETDKLSWTTALNGLTLEIRESRDGRIRPPTIKLNGESGTGTFSGVTFPTSADCAERFPVVEERLAEPGTVLVTGDDEALRPCERAYDTRVVGVVSGAGGLRPGIVLNDALEGGATVALVGRVYCKVDADHGPVAVGDLLTTSPTAGHAMRASDRDRAFGAVLGKALGALASGQGLVPILVTLQ